MNEVFTFYRAVDPMKGSWDGYGYFASGKSDFLAFVTDAPSAASVHTPELIKEFWTQYCRENLNGETDIEIGRIELADGINRLHDSLLKRSRVDGAGYQATLSIARKLGDQLLYCSVGDSVLQLFRDEKVYRLNESEIWDGSLIARETQALKERQKTQLLRFVGDGGDFVPASAIATLTLRAGDLLLFNSDGMEDLLAPDRLIPLLKTAPDQLRQEFERIFAPERIRDDITFLAVPIEIPPQPDGEKEMHDLQVQVEALKKEQAQFRNDFQRLAAPAARMERIEKALSQLSQQLQALSKKVDSLHSSRPAFAGAPRAERQQSIPLMRNQKFWLGIAVAFVFGVLLAALLLLQFMPQRRTRTVAKPEQSQQRYTLPERAENGRAQQRRVEPPEIAPAPATRQDCEYTVQRGDSLQRIAAKKKTDIESLLRWNPSLKREVPLKIGETVITCDNGL